jgi:group I intron endonuclease
MDDKRIYYVYKWIRLDTNQVFYIGKGHGNRYKDRSMRNKYFNNVVNKVGMDNIKIEIIENELDEQTAFEKEKYYIKYYRELGHKLTNMTDGGEGSSNWYSFLSDEEKQKHKEVSKSFLGKHHTEETKKKMSKSMTGLKHNFTEESRQRLIDSVKSRPAPFKGKHLSEETKEKLRNSHLGTKGKNAKQVLVLNKKYSIIKSIRSRSETFECYPDIKQHNIRKCLEHNAKISDINKSLFYQDICFIYKQDYDVLNSQSTIETVA